MAFKRVICCFVWTLLWTCFTLLLDRKYHSIFK